MRVQNISEKQSFQGRVIPKNLSDNAHELISENFFRMQRLVEDKAYNLYLTEDTNSKLLKFIVQRSNDFGKPNRPIMEVTADMRAYEAKAVVGHSDSTFAVASHSGQNSIPVAKAVQGHPDATIPVATPVARENLYLATAEYAVNEFDKIKLPETFSQKCKRIFNSLGRRLMDALQDKDEI